MNSPRDDMRLPPLEGRRPLTVRVNGEPILAFAGETVATVLLAAGRRAFRHTEQTHAPRSLFCGMGICFECLVTVDGQPNVRACVTSISNGMVIETGEAAP